MKIPDLFGVNKKRPVPVDDEPKAAKAPVANGGTPTDGTGGDGGPPTVQRGDCFFHKESRKLYQVMGFERGIMELPEGTQREIPIVVYVSFTNSKVMKLNIFAFVDRFEKTVKPVHSPKEMSQIDKNGKITATGDNTADGENPPMGQLYTPSERHILDKMIMYPEAKEEITIGINSIAKRKQMEEVWKLNEMLDNANRTILNFYGVPGTGKTMAAQCVANFVKRKLFQVDYSQIVDKYVGETAKKISLAFATAKEHGAILFFDEADSLLSKRVDMNVNSDYANSVNQNRNVLMQELDKFDDIVIMSTNFFQNYDEAMLRRINRHVEFKLPSRDMRIKLFECHIPNLERAKGINFTELAEASAGFSGGDIKNACFNSIELASVGDDPTKWNLTQKIMLSQITKIKDSKDAHKRGTADKNKKTMGFGARNEPVEVID